MKVVIIISQIDRWITFEWMAEGLRKHFDLHFILLNPAESYFESYLKANGYAVERIRYRSKKDLMGSIFQIRRSLKRCKPDVVHTHFLDANLAGLTAAWLANVPKRIHTRHHSVFHHRYSKKGILYDRWCNFLSTDIVAISQMVEWLLHEKEGVPSSKIALIHHGFDLAAFESVDTDFQATFKKRHSIPENAKIIGVISRYIEWKGVVYIIEAFKAFHKAHPEAMLLLLNARGPDKNKIQERLKELPAESYREVEFEKNIMAVYQMFSVFVHTPIDKEVEAFGQVYVEALAAGVPCVFTRSGIASEIIEDRNNALVVPYRNSESVLKAFEEIWTNNELKTTLVKNGYETAKSFGINRFCERLRGIYKA